MTESLHKLQEKVSLSFCTPGFTANLVILSWKSWHVQCNTLPFDLLTKFTEIVGNFHPYCPVTLDEKWTIRISGMRCCFGEACSNISILIGVFASLWLYMKALVLTYGPWDQVHSVITSFKLLRCINMPRWPTQSDISNANIVHVRFYVSVRHWEKTKQCGFYWI